MADHYRPTRLYRELCAIYLQASGISHIRPTQKGLSLAEAFRTAPWQGDLSHDFKNPLVLNIKNEVRWNPSQAANEARAIAQNAAIDGTFVPWFSIQRRKDDGVSGAGRSHVLMDLDTLAWILAGNKIE